MFPRQLRQLGQMLMMLACVAMTGQLYAGGLFRNAAVGGISIDANGVLKQPTVAETEELRQAIEQRLAEVPADMDQELGLRRISLRQLEAALQQTIHQDLGQLPDELRYVAGLQRIKYVLVYPEHQDIVLVGPGEGWVVNERGHVVGRTTGRPVLQLEDLLVAFRALGQGEGLIQCSIDPTEAGTQTMRRFAKTQKQFRPDVLDKMAKALGPQQITISGVPETSHFARVLVAADYRMKRFAMHLEASPVAEMPSFLQLMSTSRGKMTNMMPRWWLACDYEPMARSEDGLSWELRGQGVTVKTEDDLVADNGSVQNTGRTNPVAARWAESMTRQYDQLSRAEAVFGQVRNLMDISVVAALIQKEGMLEQVGGTMPTLFGENRDFVLQSWNPPKTVDSQCSFVKRGNDYLITASGGVEIDPLPIASRSQVSRRPSEVREASPFKPGRWWW